MATHLTQNPCPIRSQRPDVGSTLEALVLTAMRRQPEHRYQSATVLVVVDLGRLDPPLGGIAAAATRAELWKYVGTTASAFMALVTTIIVLSIVLR
jgi:hypothetical protein